MDQIKTSHLKMKCDVKIRFKTLNFLPRKLFSARLLPAQPGPF